MLSRSCCGLRTLAFMPVGPSNGLPVKSCELVLFAGGPRHAHVGSAGEWSSEELTRLGVSLLVAKIFGGAVDWQGVDQLVARGCSLSTALEIVR